MILVDKIEKFEQQIQQEIYINNFLGFQHKLHKETLGALKAELKLAKERLKEGEKKTG